MFATLQNVVSYILGLAAAVKATVNIVPLVETIRASMSKPHTFVSILSDLVAASQTVFPDSDRAMMVTILTATITAYSLFHKTPATFAALEGPELDYLA